MPITISNSDVYLQRTKLAYAGTRLLNTPFWALYLLLAFIMRKDLQATPFQIACVISINPIISLFSFYWSAQIQKRRDRLIPNIVWSGILGHLPFLFTPFIDNPWYFVFASGIYMLFYRGVNPAWMEVLKINVPDEDRKTIFAYGSAFYHVGGALLAILIAWMLDDYFQAWRWLFPITTLIAFGSIFFQLRLVLRENTRSTFSPSFFTFKEHIQVPWKNAWDLLKNRPDFTQFQIGFMLGGGALMLWKPVLPEFFLDVLHLNYKEMTLAMTVCKSIGYTLTLPIWTRAMNRFNLFVFSSFVTLIAATFPISLMGAVLNIWWLYMAYLLYGMMQAGSELSWNLSGPIFSKEEDSSLYTSVNVLMIGLRGCVAPALGSVLYQMTNASFTLIFGGICCLLATWQMYAHRPLEKKSLSAPIL